MSRPVPEPLHAVVKEGVHPTYTPGPRRLVAVEELSEMIGMTPSAIYNLRHRSPGSLPDAVKVGGSLRWRLGDIETWIDELPSEAA